MKNTINFNFSFFNLIKKYSLHINQNLYYLTLKRKREQLKKWGNISKKMSMLLIYNKGKMKAQR